LKFGFPVTIKQQKETIYKATDTNGFVPVLQGGNIMVVQHNLTAMNSNRMLGVTTKTQAKSTEKLSSGYKINRAADDAAGLSISEKMRKQIRGLTQASLNAQDGISAVQTAEGALNEVQDMLQRMNELAVKSANGTQSSDDRSYIQNEIDQLTTEIDRVAETTKFNETYLLKGDPNGSKSKDFQYKSAEVTSKDLYYLKDGNVETLKKGTYKNAVSADYKYFEAKEGSKVGTAIETAEETTYFGTELDLIDEDNLYQKNSDGSYVLVEKGAKYSGTAGDYYTLTFNADGKVATATAKTADPTTKKGYELKKDVYDQQGNLVKTGTTIASTDKAKYYKEITVAKFDTTKAVDPEYENSSVQFTDKNGNEIAANGLYKYINEDGTLKADSELYLNGKLANQDDVNALVDFSKSFDTGALTLKLHVGADATDNNQISVKLDAMSAKGLGVRDLKVDGTNDTNAKNAIETIKEAIQKVSTQRSALGAVQNRLEHTISNLDNVVENTTSAESQIRDTDMATEMVKYSNNNILAQAGQAMLAQANQSNQGVLSLLQ
jgi:flagellin